MQLAEEFRHRNLSHSAHEDVLELDRHILFTTLSLLSQFGPMYSLKRKAETDLETDPVMKKRCNDPECRKKTKEFSAEGLRVHK